MCHPAYLSSIGSAHHHLVPQLPGSLVPIPEIDGRNRYQWTQGAPIQRMVPPTISAVPATRCRRSVPVAIVIGAILSLGTAGTLVAVAGPYDAEIGALREDIDDQPSIIAARPAHHPKMQRRLADHDQCPAGNMATPPRTTTLWIWMVYMFQRPRLMQVMFTRTT